MRKIVWVLSSDGISGGASVALYHATNLARMGFDVSLVLARQSQASPFSWHPCYNELDGKRVRVLTFFEASAEKFDIAIATYWKTALMLWRINAESYLYFVQSIESRFYPEDEIVVRYLVDATYELGLGMVTVAPWMQRFLERATGAEVQVVRNGIDKALFRPPVRSHSRDKLRLLVEGSTVSPFKNVPKTIDLCYAAGVGEIWLLTRTEIADYPKVDRVFSAVPMKDVPQIYRDCDVLVKLSLVEGMFGPPLEMFHCGGTAIVYDVTGHDEYIEDGRNAIVVRTGDEVKVVRAIQALATSAGSLLELKRAAEATAQRWPSTEESTTELAQAFACATNQVRCDRRQLTLLSKRLWSIYEASRAISLPRKVEAQVAQKALAEVLRSTSWRITHPLRVGVTVARKIRKAVTRGGRLSKTGTNRRTQKEA